MIKKKKKKVKPIHIYVMVYVLETSCDYLESFCPFSRKHQTGHYYYKMLPTELASPNFD